MACLRATRPADLLDNPVPNLIVRWAGPQDTPEVVALFNSMSP